MSRTGLLTQIDQGSILHIAPEVAVEAKLVATQPMQYICGDLFPKKPSHQRIDCESLPFPNNSFDLIISNHVLEHVANPDTALSEFFRTLKPNGYLIAQTPYAPTLKRTFELDEPTSPERAEFFYGQNDHVRLFGRDIVDYFRSAGFAGELYPHEHVLPGVDPLEYGCNGREPFFLFTKLPDA
ncbi:MAG: methyltransferase domain-containing protein [Candidatus Eremiobacteraeota bacterium]|nr:methyltransferase domain-containing protein [Candidatus Eremiobacteraeota bacterium]